MPRDDTLIVSATYDDSYAAWYDALPEPKVRVSTAEGGHPSQAFIRAFRGDRKRHRAYLFLQDSLEPLRQLNQGAAGSFHATASVILALAAPVRRLTGWATIVRLRLRL